MTLAEIKKLDRNELRDYIKDTVYKRWANNNYKGFGRLSVGIGKTKVFIDFIKDHIKRTDNPKVLILVPTTNLKESGFPDEVTKWWNKEEFDKYCTISCYQSLNNFISTAYSLTVLDEPDFSLSEGVYQRNVESIVTKELIALSGTFTTEKMAIATKLWGNILIDINLTKAIQIGAINDIKITLIEVPLSSRRTIPTTSGGKWSENDKYRWIQGKITEAKIKGFNALAEKSKLHPDDDGYLELDKEVNKWFSIKSIYEYRGKINRVQFLWNSTSTIDKSIELLKQLDRTIVFATRTNTIDAITGEYSYHGKKSKSQLDKVINDFNNQTISYIGAGKKVERGVNFVNLKNGLFSTYTSSESSINQQLGRLCRLNVNETANGYFIYNTYIDKSGIKRTCQNYEWVKNALNAIGINYE